jgi:hypothetical protein
VVESASALRDAVKQSSVENGMLFKVQSPQGGVGYLLVKPEATK